MKVDKMLKVLWRINKEHLTHYYRIQRIFPNSDNSLLTELLETIRSYPEEHLDQGY